MIQIAAVAFSSPNLFAIAFTSIRMAGEVLHPVYPRTKRTTSQCSAEYSNAFIGGDSDRQRFTPLVSKVFFQTARYQY